LAEPRFDTREGRLEHRDQVIDHVQRVLLGATSRAWEARLGEVGVACGAVNDVAGALSEPQTHARGLLVRNEHPVYGHYEHLRGPLPTRGRETLRPAPLLGEHTAEALSAIGYPAERIAELQELGIVS
jgi:formyl-CoA transferase